MTSTSSNNLVTPLEEQKFNPTDVALNISDIVVRHGNEGQCPHCTNILRHVYKILSGEGVKID